MGLRYFDEYKVASTIPVRGDCRNNASKESHSNFQCQCMSKQQTDSPNCELIMHCYNHKQIHTGSAKPYPTLSKTIKPIIFSILAPVIAPEALLPFAMSKSKKPE